MPGDSQFPATGRTAGAVSISIVSHQHGSLVAGLLEDIARCCANVEVLLTVNVPETLPFRPEDFGVPVRIAVNETPRGFGANHNAAFRLSGGSRFCVVNPDIRFDADPLPALCRALEDERVGVAAPAVLSPAGTIEDSARKFPTLLSVAAKVFASSPRLDYAISGTDPITPDWVAGMFMLFRRDVFARAGGFDERYFLYYEDVDLCRRLGRLGFRAQLVPSAKVVHDARRTSHGSPRHLVWHVASLLRYLSTGR